MRETATFSIDGLGEFEIYLDITIGERIQVQNAVKNFLGAQYENNENSKKKWYETIYRAAEDHVGIADGDTPTEEQIKAIDEFVISTNMNERNLINQIEHQENILQFSFLFPLICKRAPHEFNTNLIECVDQNLFDTIFIICLQFRNKYEEKKKSYLASLKKILQKEPLRNGIH